MEQTNSTQARAALSQYVARHRTLISVICVWIAVTGTALGAYVRIPVPGSPVPITLQTLFVLLSGAMLGWRLGTISQLSYLTLGVLGLPAFAGGAMGAVAILGPTGGYLIGFVVAAGLIGLIVHSAEEPSFLRCLGAMLLGTIVIYALGLWRLAAVTGMNAQQAFLAGVVPFVPGDTLKLIVASALWRVSRGAFNR